MKALSNALFLLALVVVVVAIVTGTGWLYALAGVLAVVSFLATVVKRRRFRARKAATRPSEAGQT